MGSPQRPSEAGAAGHKKARKPLIYKGGLCAFFEVLSGYMPPMVSQDRRTSLMGNSSTTVVAGFDEIGSPYCTWANPLEWGPPRVSREIFALLWNDLTGQRMEWLGIEAATAIHQALTTTELSHTCLLRRARM